MINLYSINNTEYSKNGDATLQPLRCELTMAINGGWQLELELPYDKDEKWKLVEEGTVVRVTLGCVREQATVQQRFRVYDYRKTLTSLVAIAFPVAMESTQDAPIDNLAITNKTGVEAMALLQAKTDKYTLYTDITKRGTASISNSNLNYAIASGESGCFIDVWGGECVYDNLTYKVLAQIGDKNNASKYPVIYGRNMTGIDYERDDSGMVTRIYPISSDGIRLNGSGYIDSPIIHNYPIVHARFMSAPYQLVIDKETDNSATATATRTALAAIKTASMTPSHNITISLISGAVRVPFDYIKKHKSGDENQAGIIDSVQAMATAEIYHETLKTKANKAIKDGMMDENNGAFVVADKYLEKNWEWHEDTSVTPHAWWYGYEGDGDSVYARNEYIKIGKYYEYFNDDGYWEEYKRIPSIDLYHNDDGSWSIGYREGYYAHNEYVYATVNGTMQEWWYDSDGWYVADSSGESDFGWHGDSSSGVWFGEEDAGSEDKSKYLHDCWAFIDGTYYFFDQYGYTDADPVHSLPDYPWGRQVDEKTGKEWFGNTNKSIGAKWLYNQWIKLDGDYYYVDSEGYVRDENDSVDAVVNAYVTGLSSLKTVCNTQRDTLYTLLYQQMTAWCNRKYEAGIDKPVVTIRVDMADLSKTDEYKDYAQLERICLGDVVECIDSEHGINTQERVIGLTYDCIRGYNKNIVIGHTEASLGSILSTNTGGGSVPSGFDTSAIETALTTQGNAIATLQNGKQDKLTAGENITIVNNVISARGGGGSGDYVGLTQAQYDALPTSEKEDTSKLYLVQQGEEMVVTNYDMSSTSNVAIFRNNPMQVVLDSETKNHIYYETWPYFENYKCQVVYKNIDVTNYDYIKLNLKTAGNFLHQSSEVEEETNENYQIIIGLTTQTVTATWVAQNLTLLEVYKRFNKTNTNYGEIEIDVREKTGVYSLVVSAWSWELDIEDLRIEKVETLDRRLYWNNRQWAKFPNALRYWHETANRFYREGIHEGIGGLKDYLKLSTNEIGYWESGQGWSRCIVVRLKGNSRNVIMGYTLQTGNKHPILCFASNSALDFEWGWSNNTLNPPYGVTEWQDKSTYPVPTEGYDWYFGYGTDTATYEGTTWNILAVDCLYWDGGDGIGSTDGLSGFSLGKWNNKPDISLVGYDLLDAANAVPYTEVTTEIGVETYAFKYGGDDKIYTFIDTDGNALFKEITTDAGSLTSQMSQKQNLLTAGENIQINGNTISATDTTYEEFDGDNAGLVPAVETQSGKFLKDDGTWDDAGGGTEVEANPSDSATSTLLKLRVDDTIYGISGGSGGGSFVGLTKSEYDALPASEKEDTSKLYLVTEGGGGVVIEPVDLSRGTKKNESSMSITIAQSSIVDTWYGGSSIGAEYRSIAIDVTNVDELTYELVTTTCWAHNNANVEEQTTVRFQVQVCLFRDISYSGWMSDNMSNCIRYNTHKYTNTTYNANECKIDTSDLTGVVYLVVNMHGWNLTFSNLRAKNVDSAETTRHTYWNNAKWSQWASNRTTYGTTAPTGDANDGDLYILLDSNNSKQGEYLYMNNAWVQIE